jgi:hypothetical protein
VDTIRAESAAALADHLAQQRIARKAFEKGDVVIHLRCGDIMTGGGGLLMGFYSFDYYANIINRQPPVQRGGDGGGGTVYIVGNVAVANSGNAQDSRAADAPCAEHLQRLSAFLVQHTGRAVR